jgi:AhpD family alkylhydroperoxidase
MPRAEVEAECRELLGIVPQFLADVPDFLIESEWESFKNLELSDQTAIPNKYKELIGLGVSGATRCRYCAYFHTEAAKLFGASEDEIREAALMAKHTMAWSTYLNALQYDYDSFKKEFDQIADYIRSQTAAPV